MREQIESGANAYLKDVGLIAGCNFYTGVQRDDARGV